MNLSAHSEVVLSVIAYSFCSGTLVLLNKVILHFLPFPSLVVAFQLCAALAMIFSANYLGFVDVDPLVWKHVKPYLYYTVAFSFGIYCNMQSLKISNVETVIVFRALSPCVVAVLEALFLGREFPSVRSWSGILLIVAGAYGYASFDEMFQSQGLNAYMWPFLYLLVISFEMAYAKKLIKDVDLKTRSGPVYYTNLLGLPPMFVFAFMGKEYSNFWESLWVDARHKIHPAAIPLLLLGCVAGTGIGYSGWWCREKVSATTFTIIGVMNKCLTIVLNVLIWDKHAPPGGLAALALCLIGGSIYQQAPLRSEVSTESSKDTWEEPLLDNIETPGDVKKLDE